MRGADARVCLRTLAAAILIAGLSIQPRPAHADPAPSCTPPPDDVMIAGETGEPYASQETCENPDGSYTVCTPTGAEGNGPLNCTNHPAPPAEGVSPPVPGLPPPPAPGQP